MVHKATMKLKFRHFQILLLGAFALLFLIPVLPGWTQDAVEETAPTEDAVEGKAVEGEKEAPTAEEAPEEKPTLPANTSPLNPETLRLIEMIEKKNRNLKKREEDLLLRERNLKLLGEKVRADLDKIEEALRRSEEQVGIKRDLIEKNVKSLVKVYSAMKPAEAATLLEKMDEGIAIQILSRMKSKTAGKVMAKMNTKVARTLTEKIAGKREARAQP